MGSLGPVGIVTGLQAEAALARKHANETGAKYLVACHGPGPDQAGKAARDLIRQGAEGLLSFGLAGGLDDNIAAGDVVLATEIREGRYQAVRTTALWREDVFRKLDLERPVIEAPIAASDNIVREASDKTRLKYKTDAVAVDMESFAVGKAAEHAQLPFLAIRAISDPALQTLPVMAVEAMSADGKVRAWKVFWSLIRHPGQIGELRRLAKNTGLATSALVQILGQLGPDFCLRDYRSDLIRQLRAVQIRLS